MGEQYFSPDPAAPSQPRALTVAFEGREYRFMTDAGVFSGDGLDEGTELLLTAALPRLSGRVLDLGCGWGAVGVIAGKRCPACEVTLCDVNERACGLARENLARNRVEARVFCGDGLGAVEGGFDWILLNPPIRAGKQTVYRLFRDSAARLTQSGRLAVVIRKQQGAASAKAYLETLFQNVALVLRKKGYHVYFCEEARV